MSSVNTYFRLIKQHCHDSKRLKWFLYQGSQPDCLELSESVKPYVYLRHAKAALLKSASECSSFHYIIVDSDDEIIEQHTQGFAEQPDLFIVPSSESEFAQLFQKVVFRVIKHAPDLYVVDYQTWASFHKDALKAEQYDHQVIGDYPNRYRAVDAVKRAAAPFSAYSVVHGAYKGIDTKVTVYETEQIGLSPDGWFEVSVFRALTAAAADDADKADPTSNTGGLDKERLRPLPDLSQVPSESVPDIQVSELYEHQYFEHGTLKTLMLRRGIDSPAFIDTLSFTCQSEFFAYFDENDQWVEDDRTVMKAIIQVIEATGLNICKEVSGRNGYTYSMQFGDEENGRNFGFVAWGGQTQNGTIMFHFTGEGLAYAADGWESRLYAFLKHLGSAAKITRIDISHDFLLGQYTLDQALADWQADRYTVRQTKPQAECFGTDWLSDTQKGRTFNIGSRRSSRILYFYEKGRQLGDEESPWVRAEMRQRNKDYIIPFDTLLHPGDYLCSAYPYLSKVLDYDYAEQYRFERIKKTNGVAIEHVVKYAKMQVSPAIKMQQSLGLDAEDIVEKLLNKRAKLPKRLVIAPPKREE